MAVAGTIQTEAETISLASGRWFTQKSFLSAEKPDLAGLFDPLDLPHPRRVAQSILRFYKCYGLVPNIKARGFATRRRNEEKRV